MRALTKGKGRHCRSSLYEGVYRTIVLPCPFGSLLEERRKPQPRAGPRSVGLRVHVGIAPCGAPTAQNRSSLEKPSRTRFYEGILWKRRQPKQLIALCWAFKEIAGNDLRRSLLWRAQKVYAGTLQVSMFICRIVAAFCSLCCAARHDERQWMGIGCRRAFPQSGPSCCAGRWQ